MSRIPLTHMAYRDWGGPLRWQDEVSGVLPAAVLAYFNGNADTEQFQLVREYCEYYLNAPCWDNNPHHDDETRAELAELRAEVKTVRTAHELNIWVHKCLDIGIDPL
jgi:hypothetical protein